MIDSETSDNLIIALEPECASLYCRSIPTYQFLDQMGNAKINLSNGDKYIVVDAGGNISLKHTSPYIIHKFSKLYYI